MTPLRIAVVAFLAASSLWFNLAQIRGLFWLHPAGFGVTADSSMRVTDVDSSGTAYHAGVRVGDRFDAATSFEKRLHLEHVQNAAPGELLALRVKGKNGSPHAVKLVAEESEIDAADIAENFPWAAAGLVFVVIGSILVLLRPSTMTWAFFFIVSRHHQAFF